MNFLEINNLQVEYRQKKQSVYAVRGASFALQRGETFGIVGETGAGKTTIALSVMGLLPGSAAIPEGSVRLEDLELVGLNDKTMQSVRGAKMAMIFQNPMSSLNPTINIEKQIAEGIRLHSWKRPDREELSGRIDELLTMVGIDPIMKHSYPHELSGGMKQRVCIAIALACNPELLIADEPTTALDVTIQAQVLELMNDLKRRTGMSMIMITHDFGIIARMCDKIAVMYMGTFVETGTWDDLFLTDRHHPYTEGLFGAIPNIKSGEKRLKPIPGMAGSNTTLQPGCVFADRCSKATEHCKNEKPGEIFEGTHMIRCHLFAEGGGDHAGTVD